MKKIFKPIINLDDLCLYLLILTMSFWTVVFIFCIFESINKVENKVNNKTIIIWNDDEESIPKANSLITLELIKGDTIYIGPYNKTAKPN